MKGTIGPYRISERIGTGGMGEVFKAFDDRLNRWVAIKRIRPGKEDTDENRERFLREARATAALNHSSIVHVYDIFRDGESDCIVMEYVEGRSLQSMTANGALDPLRAIEMGQEVAEGLAAAHGKNILHRDLKTENIIVTPEGHAKILDFGLAKPLITEEFDSSLTGKGQLVGTSRAMSPEYVGGDQVDHRSDLFALGVLLYESVTGHSPFKAQNTLATLKQVIVHQQPPAREVNPEVPEEVSDLIDRLLEKSPEDRPQSAREVALELERIGGQYSSGSVDHTLGSGSDRFSVPEGEWSISTSIMGSPRLRRFWISIAAVILVLLLGAYLLGRRDRLPPTSPGERVTLVLGDFQNKTNDPLLDVSLDLAFRTGIEQSRLIKILSDQDIRDALERMQREPSAVIDREIGVQICLREGAQAFVLGTIVSVGPSYSMSAQIISAKDEIIETVTDTASSQAEILPALQRLVRDLRSNLGESLAAIESSRPLDKVTTPNLEALRLYSLGVDAQYEGTNKVAESIDLFQRALKIDPEFAMAHVKLGVAYRRVGPPEKVEEHFNEALKYKERLSPFEEIYIEGWMANQHGTPEDMIRVWSLMTSLFPDNEIGYHNIGTVNRFYRNEFQAAVDAFSSELQIIGPRRRKVAARPLGYSELALERYDEAEAVFRENNVEDGLIDTYFVKENYEEGLTALGTYFGDETNDDFLLYKSQYYIDQGQMEEARRLARKLVALYDEQQGGTSLMLVARMTLIATYLYEDSEDLDLVLDESLQKAIDMFHNDTGRLFNPIPFMATVGKIHARRADADRASEIYETIREQAENGGIDLWKGYLKMLEGEILISRGRVAEAIGPLREAIGFREPFQAHESLAYALELNGNISEAIKEAKWIERRRGRAFSECINVCGLKSKNILDWNLTLIRLGRLYEADGQTPKAEDYSRRFHVRWNTTASAMALPGSK